MLFRVCKLENWLIVVVRLRPLAVDLKPGVNLDKRGSRLL